jgi:ectoine hydroxylase-related dioxygenase (phytanoyl-CoA dioxygenase family)
MNDAEKYLFDLRGYLVVEGVLAPDEVAALNATLNEKLAESVAPDKTTHRFGGLLDWAPEFRALIAHPRIAPCLYTLVGEKCRLDHDYLDIIRSGLGPIGATLHGGGTPHDPSQSYRVIDGRMYNGLVVVVYALKDVNPGDGGFACVPGSHKANFRLPAEWAPMDEHLAACVTPVLCRAGDAIIFTEAMTHGTLPWHGKDERRSIFYKYSPHFSSWSARRYDPAAYDDLTPEARRMLEGPNARYRNRPGAVE